jgi:hypothetical protein
MGYTLFAVGGIFLALVGLFLLLRRRRRSAQQDPEESVLLTPSAQLFKLQNADRFRGVSVESHCGASSPLAGREFPFESAPNLPVSGCDATVCKCRFIGLPDRRLDPERRLGQDRRRSLRMEDDDRRHERPRRSRDLSSWTTAYRRH